MQIFNKKFIDYGVSTILCTFITLIILTMLLHDYLTAMIFNQHYSFYESILFKVNIGLLFFSVIIYRFSTKINFTSSINVNKVLIYLIPLCLVHVLISSLVMSFIGQTFLDLPFTFSFFIQKKFTKDFLFLLTVYGLMYLMIRHYALLHKNSRSHLIKTLKIKTGKETVILAIKDIDWIGAETPYVSVNSHGKKYLYHATMAKIITLIDTEKFVRIHRSTIVNTDKIHRIISRSNGDYDIILLDQTQLRLSRNYSQNLKDSQLKY